MPIWEQPDDVRVAMAQARVERDIVCCFAHLRVAPYLEAGVQLDVGDSAPVEVYM